MTWSSKGGGEGVRQCFVLSDHNFPAVLPCENGECLKIIRIEDGSLPELVNCWLELTQGKNIPAGSVLLIFSATHLLMEGLGGFMEDLVTEIRRLESIFGGGVIPIPGIPVFLGGCNSKEVIRETWDLMGWMRSKGELKLPKAWSNLVVSLLGGEGAGNLQGNRTTRTRMPESLKTYANRSWVSPGGAMLFNELQPAPIELEKKIICGLLKDLNANFDLGLDTAPDFTRTRKKEPAERPKILMIGASNAGRAAAEFEERGYTVLKICTPGWRANKDPVQQILPKVQEALKQLKESDVVIIQCLDNTAYYSRTEEGGDIPIRKYDNKFHVEGDLVLATKERQRIMFNNLEPLLQLLGNRKVILTTPSPRYLYENCCERDDHATNRHDEDFEETMRASLREFRINFKSFLFARNMKMKVLDPSPVLRKDDYEGEPVWGKDPVHPLANGYRLLVDLYESEMTGLTTAGRKRAGGQQPGQNKRQKTEERRPDWVAHSSTTAVRRERQPGGFQRGRGWRTERGRGRGRGRGSERGRRGN